MFKKRKIRIAAMLSLGFAILLVGFTVIDCPQGTSQQQMIGFLEELKEQYHDSANPFYPEAKLAHVDSMLNEPRNGSNPFLLESKAALALKAGQEEESVKTYESLIPKMNFMDLDDLMPSIAIAYMRLGERSNCMLNHNGSSCIFPLKGGGVHLVRN